MKKIFKPFKQRMLLFIALFGLLISVQQLQAHAELLEAIPGPGEILIESPTQVLLTFDEPLKEGSDIFIFTSGFQYVEDITVSIGGSNDRQLIADLPPLAANEYNVQWSVISADGHAISGTYAFQVQAKSASTDIFYWLIGVLMIGFGVIGVVFWKNRGKYETAPNGL
ncbi:MAG: copper resistance CopC family protein [Chloroflexota bacterium]